MPNLTALAPRHFAFRKLFHRMVEVDAGLRPRADLRRLDERTLRDIGVTCTDIDAELSRLALLGL